MGNSTNYKIVMNLASMSKDIMNSHLYIKVVTEEQ